MEIIVDLIKEIHKFNGTCNRYIVNFHLFNGDEIQVQFVCETNKVYSFILWNIDMKMSEKDIGKAINRIVSDMNALSENVSMNDIINHLPILNGIVDVKAYIDKW